MKQLAGIILLLGLWGVAPAAEPEMRLSSKKVRDEVRAIVEGQLAALQAGKFEVAYGYAASGIKRQFDEQVFTLMIKRGYPALVRPGKVDPGLVRDDGKGSAQVVVTVTDQLNREITYRYLLVKEAVGWRISGVVPEPKPPRGDI